MKNIINTLLILFISMYSSHIKAELVIEGPNNFKSKVKINLSEARNNSKHLSKLIQNIKSSSSIITIKPITNDQSTWHKSGKKSRSHTKALDNKSRGAERNTPTNSIIYINTNRITQAHQSYNSGILVHEIVHALDLANGKYHSSYPIREKRAIFFQNIWRNIYSKKLRTDYHGIFETNDYQKAIKTGKLEKFVNYYFAHNDIP